MTTNRERAKALWYRLQAAETALKEAADGYDWQEEGDEPPEIRELSSEELSRGRIYDDDRGCHVPMDVAFAETTGPCVVACSEWP